VTKGVRSGVAGEQAQQSWGRSGISVIIPVRDREVELRRCLEALLAGTLVPDEVIVVDDASRDGSGAVAREFGCCVLRNQVRQGTSAARNRGATHAQGEILLFLDSDVLVGERTLERLVTELRTSEDWIQGVNAIYTDEPPGRMGLVSRFANYSICYQHLHHPREVWTMFTACCAVWREFFLEIKGFDDTFQGPHCDDVAIQYRIRSERPPFRWCRDAPVGHLKRYRVVSTSRIGSRLAVLSSGWPAAPNALRPGGADCCSISVIL